MSEESSVGTGQGATQVSGFGGHPLGVIAAGGYAVERAEAVRGFIEGGALDTLATLGLADAEQVLAVTSVPGVSDQLRNALRMEADAFRSLVDAARSVLPRARADLVSQSAPRDLGLGVRMPTDEMIAAAEGTVPGREGAMAPAAATLPISANLISYLPPVRNQAARGTCVGFALTALNEYSLRRRGRIRNLSEQHLYYETKLIDGAPNECGTWQAKAVLALRDRGECRESVWPYNPNPPCNNHGALPGGSRADGLKYRCETFEVPTRDVVAYKTELARQRPVTLSIPVYDSWYQSVEARRSGRITMRIGNEVPSGGHAVCLVGYQDTQSSPGGGYFLVRNSWSTAWAYESPYGGGYGTIPYQYIADDAWEAFSTVIPGLPGEAEEDDTTADEETTTRGASVRINVGRDITITIDLAD